MLKETADLIANMVEGCNAKASHDDIMAILANAICYEFNMAAEPDYRALMVAVSAAHLHIYKSPPPRDTVYMAIALAIHGGSLGFKAGEASYAKRNAN